MNVMTELLDAELATMNSLRDDLGLVDRYGNGYGPHDAAEGRYLRALDRATHIFDGLDHATRREVVDGLKDANSWIRDQHEWRRSRLAGLAPGSDGGVQHWP